MVKVISFSLWGSEKKYTIGAIKNAELAKEVYPDFQFVGQYVYEDESRVLKHSEMIKSQIK